MSIFVENRQQVRAEHNLGHSEFFPSGMTSFEHLDGICERLADEQKLIVVDSQQIRSGMETLRRQDLTRAQFQSLSDKLQSYLVQAAMDNGLSPESAKASLSLRAGLAFMPILVRMRPGLKYGFLTQERDETNPLIVASTDSKLRGFEGKQAFLFDPMLATGGSACDAVDSVMRKGATSAVIVASFASPEGVVRVSQHEAVEKIITFPLEAGLNEHGYIVGGLGATAMLGDFGDRYLSD